MSGRNHNQYTQLRAQWRLGSRGSAAEWIPRLSRLICAAALLLSLIACASGPRLPPAPKLPYPAWYVSLVAPRHMEVWVESVDVLDQRDLAFYRVHGGGASYTGTVRGWPTEGGGGKPVNNVDLPKTIHLRWQSLVEPQAYKIRIDIPQWIRDEMVKPQKVFCAWDQKTMTLYPQTISLGMAPGGIVKVWVGAGCIKDKEVGRFQAEVEPRGPYLNDKGLFYRAPNPAAQAWIDQHGIPYGSW